MPTFAMPPAADPQGHVPAVRAIHMALRDELAAHDFYQAVLLSFGPAAPWPQLASANARRIHTLLQEAARRGMTLPPRPPRGLVRIIPGWRGNLERGLHGCVASASRYQHLIATCRDPALCALLQRCQDDLLGSHIPMLQRAWQAAADRERYHAMQGVDAHQAYNSHGLIGDTIEQLLALLTRQGGVFGLVGTVLRAAHPALVAGALTGSAAVQGVRLRQATAQASKIFSQEE